MAKKVFLLELNSKRFDQSSLGGLDIELVASIFDAEAVIIDGGYYCCRNVEDGWRTIVEIFGLHSTRKFWVLWGHDKEQLHADVLKKDISNATFIRSSQFHPSQLLSSE